MNVSAFDLFKVGIGPSSSHTVGPMIAASRFATRMRESGVLEQVRTMRIELYGSLGATGKGHGTDKAVLLGLEGNLPDTVDPDYVEQRLIHIRTARSLDLAGVHRIDFDEKTQLAFLRREVLPFHPNGIRFTALDERGAIVDAQAYYSVGGGFVVDDEGERLNGRTSVQEVPYPFSHRRGSVASLRRKRAVDCRRDAGQRDDVAQSAGGARRAADDPRRDGGVDRARLLGRGDLAGAAEGAAARIGRVSAT